MGKVGLLKKTWEKLQIIKADNKIDIEVRAATDDGAIPLNIKRVEDINGKPVDIDGQWIRGIDLQQKNEIKLNVFFEENDKFSLYLRAYANK